MTKKEARKTGSLCTGRYKRGKRSGLSLPENEQIPNQRKVSFRNSHTKKS